MIPKIPPIPIAARYATIASQAIRVLPKNLTVTNRTAKDSPKDSIRPIVDPNSR